MEETNWKTQGNSQKRFQVGIVECIGVSFSHDDNIDDEFDEIRFDLVDLIL